MVYPTSFNRLAMFEPMRPVPTMPIFCSVLISGTESMLALDPANLQGGEQQPTAKPLGQPSYNLGEHAIILHFS